jgi:hypothetical protein
VGLAERRAIKEFETNRFPDLKQRIDQAAKFEVTMEVKWDTIAVEGESHLYDDSWPKVYFYPLIAALKSVCQDELGQEALREGLKQIIVQNMSGAYYGDRWAHFQKGVLLLDHLPTTNIDDVDDRTKGLIKVLESGL